MYFRRSGRDCRTRPPARVLNGPDKNERERERLQALRHQHLAALGRFGRLPRRIRSRSGDTGDARSQAPLSVHLGQPRLGALCPLSGSRAHPADDRNGRVAVDPVTPRVCPLPPLNRAAMSRTGRTEKGRKRAFAPGVNGRPARVSSARRRSLDADPRAAWVPFSGRARPAAWCAMPETNDYCSSGGLMCRKAASSARS